MINLLMRLLCNALYYTGHFVSIIVETRFGLWLFPVYVRLMRWSLRVSDRYQLGIWTRNND